MIMKWIDQGWNVSSCRLGAFTVTVQPVDGGVWKVDLNGVVAAKRFGTVAEAKLAAPRIAKAWFTKALAELSEEKT